MSTFTCPACYSAKRYCRRCRTVHCQCSWAKCPKGQRVGTASQLRAWSILRTKGPMRPGWFARQMWPDSPCWRRAYKCGPNGSSRGIAMARSAGAYLAKLARAGLARRLDDGRYAAKAMTECGNV